MKTVIVTSSKVQINERCLGCVLLLKINSSYFLHIGGMGTIKCVLFTLANEPPSETSTNILCYRHKSSC